MSYSIGDGLVALALAGGIVGWHQIVHRTRQKRIDIIHQERMAAMEKGIPLPELPPETAGRRPSDDQVLPILGIVLTTLSVGAMIVLSFNLPVSSHSLWISPLPLTFLGVGMIAFYFLQGNRER